MKTLPSFSKKRIRKLSYSQDKKLFTLRIVQSQFIDNYINNHVNNLKKQIEQNKKINNPNNKNNININSIPFKIDEQTDRIIEYIFSKAKKNSKEIIFIQHYLTTFSNLVEAIYEKKLMTEPNHLLWQIAKFLKYETYEKNDLIFRYGDEGDKFYMIFTGNVAVIIPKERKIKMTVSEYIKYLKKLMTYKEFGLIDKIIDKNFDIFFNEEISEIKHNLFDISNIQKLKLKKSESRRFSNTKNIFPVEKIKIEDYINRIKPELNNIKKEINEKKEKEKNEEKEEKKENEKEEKEEEKKEEEEYNIIIYDYIIITELKSYSTFGDIALSTFSHKRTATIFSINNSSFGTLDNKTYQKCVKTSQHLARNKNISCIKNIPFFEKLSFDYFTEKYSNYFHLINVKRGDIIFKQKEKRKKVYFIKEGEVELIMKGSIKDINTILNIFDKKDIKRRNHLLMDLKYEEDTTSYLYTNDNYVNVWKIIKVFKQDVFGLDDCIYDDFYFVNAKFSNEFGELYEIDYDIFKNIVSNKFIKNSFEKFQKEKIDLMAVRLKKIRNAYIKYKYRDKEKKYNIYFEKNHSQKFNSLVKQKVSRNKVFSLKSIKSADQIMNDNIEIKINENEKDNQKDIEIDNQNENNMDNYNYFEKDTIDNNKEYDSENDINKKKISSYNYISHSRCLSYDNKNNHFFITSNRFPSTFNSSYKSIDNTKNSNFNKLNKQLSDDFKIRINITKPKKKCLSKNKITSLMNEYIQNEENILNNDILPNRFNEKYIIHTNSVINSNNDNEEESKEKKDYSKLKLTLSSVNLGIPIFKIGKYITVNKKKHNNCTFRNQKFNSLNKIINKDKKIFKSILTYN